MAAFEIYLFIYFFGGVVGNENVICPLQDSPFFPDGKKIQLFLIYLSPLQGSIFSAGSSYSGSGPTQGVGPRLAEALDEMSVGICPCNY